MADTPLQTVSVNLPADLVARMEELRQDRDDDRKQSVEQIVQRLCRAYVAVREKARWEKEHLDEINRSYEKDPSDWDDSPWDTLEGSSQEEHK